MHSHTEGGEVRGGSSRGASRGPAARAGGQPREESVEEEVLSCQMMPTDHIRQALSIELGMQRRTVTGDSHRWPGRSESWMAGGANQWPPRAGLHAACFLNFLVPASHPG